MKPTVYVKLRSAGATSPLPPVIGQIASAFGAEVVEELVRTGDVEADIAIVDSVDGAMSALKETETTTVVLAWFRREEGVAAEAFAGRNPRVRATHFVIESGGGPAVVPVLLGLIAEKGGNDARPAP